MSLFLSLPLSLSVSLPLSLKTNENIFSGENLKNRNNKCANTTNRMWWLGDVVHKVVRTPPEPLGCLFK